jgi:rhodanese-related sulfurtransferase
VEIATISPSELAERHRAGEPVEVIDVRTPVEFQEVHCTLARNVPLSGLDPAAVAGRRTGTAGQPLYVICRSGSRGRQACERFHAAGFTGVVNVDGGTVAWADAGLPVVRGRTVMALERQVRIVAGSLVFVGSALGLLVHPGFLAVPAFVGAGLVFAGVTDTCGMGMLLARMPWNRAPAQACPVTR